MSLAKKAFKEGSWLGIFKLISQTFSWICTFWIARILVPEDYGLMEMATIITGYAMMFSHLGLGAAIIQRPSQTHEELSSIFWFAFCVSLLFAVGCFIAAYPTAYLFNEPRVIPITKTVSILFVIMGLQIVPLNLLKKELDFKKIGSIQMAGVFVSCIFMVIVAYQGGGVWTLIGGHVVRSLTTVILIYLTVKWLPKIHFDYLQVKSYLKFGITLSLSTSFLYVSEKSDRFFAGRAWPANTLGYYSLALNLSQIPMDKIVSMINQISFPLYSKLQNCKEEFNQTYINILKFTASIIFPIYFGGFLLGEEIIKLLLNEKWFPIIFLFKYLCLCQIITMLKAINNRVHTALGRPHWNLCLNATLAILMSISFYFAVKHGLKAIIIPWATTYTIICLSWIYITINKLGISVKKYVSSILPCLISVMAMTLGIILSDKFMISPHNFALWINFIVKFIIGSFCYIVCLWYLDKNMFYKIKSLIQNK